LGLLKAEVIAQDIYIEKVETLCVAGVKVDFRILDFNLCHEKTPRWFGIMLKPESECLHTTLSNRMFAENH
jgi:hypothetical protein